MAQRWGAGHALGTTTELRSQKNYTGHRLAPWLSHMMVSRQETQRALITPGEVMQLSADDEIVMVSGTPPVLARKLRYFKDGNFTKRILSPASVEWGDATCDPEWTSIVAAPPFKEPEAKDREEPDSLSLRRTREPEHTIDDDIEKSAPEPNVEPSLYDDLDSASDQNLETIRRAVTADRGDPDVLPGF
ncbi:MAG: type IV secretory system conjugative DNA transfer family protein [Henriciella sp.]